MGLCAAADDAQAALGQLRRQARGVVDDALLERPEAVGPGQLERQRQGRNCVEMRSALLTGKDGAINLGGQIAPVGQDHRAARPAEALVCGGRDDVGNADRAGMHAGGDEAGDVGNVGHQVGAAFVGDGAEALPVDDHRVGGVAGDDDLGPDFKCLRFDGVVVEQLGLGIDEVGDALVDFAGAVDFGAM